MSLLDDALQLAEQGLPVFPCNPQTKQPLVGKRKDANRKEIPNSGGHHRATTDPKQIRRWWTGWPDALIGVPTGPRSGFAVLDLDVKNGKDGLAAVPDWETRSTVIARTQSGGAHLYFDAAGAPHCTSDEIALGVDTRGDGGYVIVPPSPGYTYVNGADLKTLPPWPDDLRPQPREERTSGAEAEAEADPALVAAALAIIPNDDRGWDDWNRIGMATWRATGGSDAGRAAFTAWSQKSRKFDAERTAERWRHYSTSPPTKLGAGTLFYEANQASPGWRDPHLLERMNAEYCAVVDGGKARVLRFQPQVQTHDGQVVHRRLVPEFLSFGDLHNFHKNEKVLVVENDKPKLVPLGNWWTGHAQRRTYRGLTFRPDIEAGQVDGCLNLWRGWGVQRAPGDWSLMQQHIEEVIAAGDEKAKVYILNWLTWTLQHPAERAQVALVLRGGRGSGRGTLGNAMCRILGQHASHISSIDHLAGRFNAHLRDCVFLFADEAYWPGDRRAEGTLKRVITEPTLFIEAKGRDSVTVPNMLHVMMASNQDWVVPAGEHERRFAMFDVSEHRRQDEGWFKPLYRQLADGGYAAMLHDLLRRTLGDWHPRKVPMTEALLDQQVRSLEPLDAWVVAFLQDGALPADYGVNRPDVALSRSQPDVDGRNPRNGIFDLARDRVPALRFVDEQVLARHLREKVKCTPWRDSDRRGWQFPPLAECRKEWEERYPGWSWQHPDITEWQTGVNREPIGGQPYRTKPEAEE
jgi:hypothetical protein